MPPASGARPATIGDVAQRAGVSLSTVSRALNGNPTVDPALAERVRIAARELDYTASPLARSLVLGRTQTVAVVVPDLGNPTFQEVLRGLSRAAGADGYHVLIADSAEVVTEERIMAIETRRRADGLILCAPRMSQDELDALLPAVTPAVLVNRRSPAGVPSIAAAYGTALADLLEHFHGLGHRHLVYLAGITRSASNASRLEAIAHFRARHPDTVVDEIACGVDFEAGATVVDAALATGATGVLAFNDLVAMGFLSAARAQGVGVPEQVSVAGFDDIPFARYTTPALTTAAVPAGELGARAWREMNRLLNEDASLADEQLLVPRLIVRESTGPVAG